VIKTGDLLNEFKTNINLEKEYNDNLKNKEFKDLVAKFNLPKETMMKYNSQLEQSSKEFSNCLDCPGLEYCQNEITGHAYLPKVTNSELSFRYKACRYQEKIKKATNHLKYVKSYHMPASVVEASWDKIDKRYAARKETLIWLTDFMKNYPNVNKGLYLHGSFGGGKSYLITAMFNEMAKQNVRSMIIFFSETIQELKSSFDTDFSDRILNLKKTPLLLIDDFGAENMTPWVRDEIICPILQYRMDEKLPTFITSNLDLEALEDHLSLDGKEVVKAKRIIERVKQLCDVLEMNSANMRK